MRSSGRHWGSAVVAAAFLVIALTSGSWAAESGRPSYVYVVVREGQTLWSISRAYGVSVETIVEVNGLNSPDAIRAGQRLKIPVRAAPKVRTTTRSSVKTPTFASRTHVVIREGQTLWSISRAYGVSVETIVEMNRLRSADAIRAGQRLAIPVRGAARPASNGAAPRVRQVPRSSGRAPSLLSQHQFVWPARGHLTSLFGWRRRARRHHAGIDIGAPWGSPIVAARAGVVYYVGWYMAYGRMVILDHGSGVTTIYAHASKILVREGQRVAAGQPIAKIGCTGRCTGPHLHFEIRVNGRALDPLRVSLVDSLPPSAPPSPAPKTVAAAKPTALSAAQTGASVDQVVRRTMVADGPNGQIIQTVEETLRNGQVVRRMEMTTSVEAGQVVRVTKTYELVNGSLELKDEKREVVEAISQP